MWIAANCCWIAIEKPVDAFTSGSSDSPADADVIRGEENDCAKHAGHPIRIVSATHRRVRNYGMEIGRIMFSQTNISLRMPSIACYGRRSPGQNQLASLSEELRHALCFVNESQTSSFEL
jgi:hypothetical protein